MDLSITRADHGDQTVVHLGGEIDVYTAPLVREKLDEQIQGGRTRLVVDLTDVTFLDSTGLGVLVGRLKLARTRGGSMRLVGKDDRVLKVFSITGLDKVFEIHPDLDAALAAGEAAPPGPACAGRPGRGVLNDTPVVDERLVALLRADLAAADFTVDGVAERLGPVASAALHREQPLPALLATEPSGPTSVDDPCGTLVRLFTLGRPVRASALAAALPTLGVDGAVALGLVRLEGGRAGFGPERALAGRPAVAATCDLRPYGDDAHDWWVASDLSELAVGGPAAPRPRARHRRRLDDPRVVDRPAPRRPGPRPRHRLRRAGPAPHRPRRLDRRHRHLRAGAGVCRLQPRARGLRRCRGGPRARAASPATCSIPLPDSGSRSS